MRILITVTTYPRPSLSYDELVCTAGIREDGSWIRIYPVPFKFLGFRKYQWVDLDLIPRERTQDFRPESYRPRQIDLSDLTIVRRLNTRQNWYERKRACLGTVYTQMASLIAASRKPRNISLAAFRPARIKRLIVEQDDRQWKESWLDQLKQSDLFTTVEDDAGRPRIPLRKIPYKFKYEFEDESGRQSTMGIEDWEIGALYWNCLDDAGGDEKIAVSRVRQKYEEEFLSVKEITLFLGTTLEHHLRRHTNPFTIIGVFYPPREDQDQLF